MIRNSTYQYWRKTVEEAYLSGEQIKRWCAERGINSKNFHRWANKFGYTENGKKTDKYYALIEGRGQPDPMPAMAAPPEFVEVPAKALDVFRGRVEAVPDFLPYITIRSGRYQVGIRDGFEKETLSKVLEVLRDA